MQETVVLIHGFGEDSQVWDNIIAELKQEYQILVPDLPGSGINNADSEGISMESMAEFIKELLDEQKIDTCSMIGHSMGGYITLAFAEKYPERLNRFGLFHSTAFADNDEKKEARKKNIDFIQKHGSAKFIGQTMPNLFAEDTSKNNPGIIKEMIDRYRNFSPDSLVNYTRAMMERPDRVHVLKTFPKPVLFIMGEKDTAVPIEQGLKQCSIPEFSYIYIATRSGHMGMIEEPFFCVKALKEFLSAK